MRKWLALLLLLVPVFHGLSQPQVDASSQLVLATGTADSNETKISNRPGTAFFDFGVDMTAWVGEMIEIKDASGRVMAGIVSTVGTGETLGSELCSGATPWSATTSPPSYYYDTFTSSDANTITSVVDAADGGLPATGCTALVTGYNGGVFKFSGTLTLNSGTAPYFSCGNIGELCPQITLANGATTGYTFVKYGTNASAGLGNATGATNWSMAYISIKQLTAPSSTGHWIVAAPGSTTKNWAYFDPLFMSGPYSWRIISKNILGSSDDVFVTSGSVTAANMKFSGVAGTAFVDFSAASVLTDYVGKKLVITNAGRTATGYIKAAGDNETYSENKIADPGFSSTSGWTIGGSWDISGGTLNKSGGTVGATYCSTTKDYLALMLFSIDSVSYTGGTFSFWANNGGTNWYSEYFSGTGTKEAYYTHTYGGVAGIRDSSSSLTATLDNFNEYQVLTPSTTGVTIVSTPGGSTYNWTSITSAFDPNSGTSTYKIYTPMSGTVTAGDVHLVTDDGNASITVTGLDLSGFAGNDSGGTKTIINEYASDAATITTQPYLLTFYDSSGRQAKGFAGAAYNTTGVKLFSTRSGTTQNLAGSDSGFDKAAVTKWKSWRTY